MNDIYSSKSVVHLSLSEFCEEHKWKFWLITPGRQKWWKIFQKIKIFDWIFQELLKEIRY